MNRRTFCLGVGGAMLSPLLATAGAQKIVITGHLGNIGSRLFDYFRAYYDIIGIDKKNVIEHDLGLNTMSANMPQRWWTLFASATAVIHLAAKASTTAESWEYLHNNSVATRNVVTACLHWDIPTLVFASSTWVDPHRYNRPGYNTNHWPCGQTPNGYGDSKRYGEQLVRDFGSSGGRSGTSVRIGWAPAPGTPKADAYAESIRNDTAALIAAFEDALARSPGAHMVELAKPIGDCPARS